MQLSSTRPRLERCQKKLAKMRVLANKNASLVQNLDKLSPQEKLIFDQFVMKANAKSPKAARCPDVRRNERKEESAHYGVHATDPCYPSRKVQALIDPPHVFKCIKNNLQKVGKFLLPQGHEVTTATSRPCWSTRNNTLVFVLSLSSQGLTSSPTPSRR
ncbi:hypothetical protein MRX96_044681 [Rhipicephalus microplus]